MKTIKVGVVGLGMVAQIMHLPYLHDMDEFEITAVCDASEKLSKAMSNQYGVENRYTDFDEMIEDADLDAVFILTFYHSDIAIAAANAGLHVFCEKPVAFSVQECEEMAAAVEKAGTVFMTGYMKRYDDSFILGKKYFDDMLKKNDVRHIVVHDACFQNDLALNKMYRLRSYKDIPPKVIKDGEKKMMARIKEALGDAPKNAVAAYRVLLETGSHDVNVLRGAFGSPKRILFTEIWPEGNWLTSTLDYGDGILAQLSVARTARNWPDEYITAYGMENTVTVQFPIPFQKSAETLVKRTFMKGDSTTDSVTIASHAEAFFNELEHFAKCVRRKKQPLTSIEDSIEDTKLMVDIIKNYYDI